ncbi:MAG: hypothetical protein R2712_07295 [Vicinamibacterales bacterium]
MRTRREVSGSLSSTWITRLSTCSTPSGWRISWLTRRLKLRSWAVWRSRASL